MKRLVLLFCLFPWTALAANGDACRITPPSTVETGSTTTNTAGACVDLLDYTAIDGTVTAGPFWMPLQNSPSTTFTIMGDTTDCLFDTLDIVRTMTSGSPADNWKEVLGTLDDDGTGGSCAGGAICVSLHVPYPIAGYIWITSNGATVGGASCTSFKLRMTQAAK